MTRYLEVAQQLAKFLFVLRRSLPGCEIGYDHKRWGSTLYNEFSQSWIQGRGKSGDQKQSYRITMTMDEHLTRAAEYGTKALSDVTDIFDKLAGPLAEELGKLFGDKVRDYRIRNLVKILVRTRQMLVEARIEAQSIPSRLFLPAVEAASVEDHETLQERWAALLANAANPNGTRLVLPSFVEVLKGLTPQEALFLTRLNGRLRALSIHAARKPKRLFDDSGTAIGNFATLQEILITGEPTISADARRAQAYLMVDDLVRLGIINRVPWYPSNFIQRPAWERIGEFLQHLPGDSEYFLTTFGLAFLDVCEPPTPMAPGGGS